MIKVFDSIEKGYFLLRKGIIFLLHALDEGLRKLGMFIRNKVEK